MRYGVLAAFGLAQHVDGYLPGTGSFVAGNLGAAAPYGIPPDEFNNVTKRVFSTATFNMTGYSRSACLLEDRKCHTTHCSEASTWHLLRALHRQTF